MIPTLKPALFTWASQSKISILIWQPISASFSSHASWQLCSSKSLILEVAGKFQKMKGWNKQALHSTWCSTTWPTAKWNISTTLSGHFPNSFTKSRRSRLFQSFWTQTQLRNTKSLSRSKSKHTMSTKTLSWKKINKRLLIFSSHKTWSAKLRI